MSKYRTFVSTDHALPGDAGVPVYVTLPDGSRQGDTLPDTGQLIVQFCTGDGFSYYVALLDFEDWGDERCPRYAVYRWRGDGRYDLADDVAERLVWPVEAR